MTGAHFFIANNIVPPITSHNILLIFVIIPVVNTAIPQLKTVIQIHPTDVFA